MVKALVSPKNPGEAWISKSLLQSRGRGIQPMMLDRRVIKIEIN